MRIVEFEQWANAKEAKRATRAAADATESPEWFGVAIGPRSDEGRVLVDGTLLQAGRPLALRRAGMQGYTIERFTPYDPQLACIRYLELQLYESLEELALECARPNGRYGDTAAINDTTQSFSYPFVGRREARFLVTGPAAATLTYSLYGLMWSDTLKAVKKKLLKSETGVVLDAGDNTYAFYLGGTDNAEAWDALRLDISTPALQTWSIDVETIGELGVR